MRSCELGSDELRKRIESVFLAIQRAAKARRPLLILSYVLLCCQHGVVSNAFDTISHGTFYTPFPGVEVIAVLPTIQKKTDNIREFLCKKKAGDMVYIPSVKQLITESNRKEMSTREKALYGHKRDHKNILNMIDSVNILSMEGATLLMLNWEKYHAFEEVRVW